MLTLGMTVNAEFINKISTLLPGPSFRAVKTRNQRCGPRNRNEERRGQAPYLLTQQKVIGIIIDETRKTFPDYLFGTFSLAHAYPFTLK